jgi:cysteinyl-tRNA synthetase
MRQAVRNEFCSLGAVLGLLQPDRWQFKSQKPHESQAAPGVSTKALSDEEIADKIAARLAAKQSRDYKLADQLRSELASHGIIIEDRPDGTSRWKR